MTRAELTQLEDEASAAMAIRGDWERAYRRSKTQHNWRELTIANAHAVAAMHRLESARTIFATQQRAFEQAARIEAAANRAAAQPSLF